ncbi:MAG: hypothetical protein AAGA68_02390 [Pseudomonadota bacterium]
MKRLKVIGSAVCAALVCLSVYAQNPGENGSVIRKQTPEEARLQDLKLVAEAKGWTLAEAAADRQAADAVGAVAEQLAALRPDIFVGSVVSPVPGASPSLYIKGVADQMVYDLLATSSIPITLVDNQPYSLEELERRMQEVHSTLADEGYRQIATAVDFREQGVVRAEVTRQDGLPTSPSSVKALLPSSLRGAVEVAVRDEPVAKRELAFGGMEALDGGRFECTSGWSVTERGTGRTGVTTAGHCNGIDQIGIESATHRLQHIGIWGDIEWKTTSGSEPSRFYASASQTRDTLEVEPLSNISIGESICVYGRSRNSRRCNLDVAETSVICTFDGDRTERMIRMTGDETISGDSGGGWSWNNRAYGSHIGDCGGNVFSVADLFYEAIGVDVRTPPILTVSVIGTGTGRLTSSPSGISCPTDCEHDFNPGTVRLTATADPGSVFNGFTGDADCTDGVISLSPTSVVNCRANFEFIDF